MPETYINNLPENTDPSDSDWILGSTASNPNTFQKTRVIDLVKSRYNPASGWVLKDGSVTSYNASAGDKLFTDITTTGFEINLPETNSFGDTIEIFTSKNSTQFKVNHSTFPDKLLLEPFKHYIFTFFDNKWYLENITDSNILDTTLITTQQLIDYLLNITGNIDDCMFLFVADTLTLSDNQRVSLWEDLSSYNRDAFSYSSSYDPLFKKAFWNNKSAIEFGDSSTRRCLILGSNHPLINDTSGLTQIALVSQDSDASGRYMNEFGSNADKFLSFSVDSDLAFLGIGTAIDTDWATSISYPGYTSPILGTSRIYFNNTKEMIVNNFDYQLVEPTNLSKIDNTTITYNDGRTTTSGCFTIGCQAKTDNESSRYFKGKIFLTGLWKQPLSNAQITEMYSKINNWISN